MIRTLATTEYIPKGASTTTRLHELAHKILGHKFIGQITVDKFIRDELDAEIWAFQRMSRPLTYMVSIPVLLDIIGSYRINPHYVFPIIIRQLKDKGVILNCDNKADLWERVLYIWSNIDGN